ncbi:UNVERIFIED_CONTAM: hypothetical protein RMT77_009619 [Armadillidium vulgare]
MAAEEIDKLLIDLEDDQEEIKTNFTNTENTSSKLRKNSKNKSNLLGLDEDIDEILNDTDISTKGKHNFGEEAPLRSPLNAKCSSPLLSGTSDIDGKERCCNNLGCLSCDSQVVCFEGFRWRDSTDYLFLRTNYPDGQKLKAQMEPSRPTCSYCCQCSHVSVSELKTVKEFSKLKWICRGHSVQ